MLASEPYLPIRANPVCSVARQLSNERQSVTCSHAHSVRIWSSVFVPGWAPHMGRGRAGDVMAHVARRADEGPLPEA